VDCRSTAAPVCCAIVLPDASRTTTVTLAGLFLVVPDATARVAPATTVRVVALETAFLLKLPLSDSLLLVPPPPVGGLSGGGGGAGRGLMRNAESAVFQCVERYEPAGGAAARK